MEKKMQDEEAYKRKRKIWGVISLVVLVALTVFLTVFIMKWLKKSNATGENFITYIQSFGPYSRLVALGIQILQVVVALIPGEAVEIGMGLVFGYVEGTVLCYIGVAIASALIFLLVKRFGVKLVELFMSREKIDNLRFINSEKKLERMIFILFFIPGTPKDLLTYFVGLTRIKFSRFMVISLIARFPSVVSSVVGGDLIAKGKIWQSVVLFAAVCLVSLAGMLLYNRIVEHRNRKNAE